MGTAKNSKGNPFGTKGKFVSRAKKAGTRKGFQTLESAIGHEVRSLRHKHDLGIAELSRQAGVSAGMLSKIENGAITPSLGTLKSIADALNVPITTFFERYEEKRDATFVKSGRGLTIERRGSQAGHRYQLLGHSVRAPVSVEPFLVTLDEGSDAYPVFRHEGVEFIYVLKGAMTYRHADQTYPLQAGDSLFFDSEAPHGPEHLQRLPVTFLSIIVAPGDPGRGKRR